MCYSIILFLYVVMLVCVLYFFFFKQKTAYELRISDWSSDVCSSDLFVAALLLAALLVWLGWRIHDPSRAFEVTLALLVISCPCALSLSIPAALAVAHGALARIGVLALRPDALETLADATDVVFDKTGTLSRSEEHTSELQSLMRT